MGKTHQVSVPPRHGEAYESAAYRVWLPDGVRRLRGLIIRQHGCGPGAREHGLLHADDIQWRALAQKHGCALMGTRLVAPDEDCPTWYVPANGSANALGRALRRLARMSSHPELARVPWALWGHSGGAMWVTNMTFLFPDRVLTTFARSGALTCTGRRYKAGRPAELDSAPRAFGVPVLFCYGEKEAAPDNGFRRLVTNVWKVFGHGRRRDAPWAYAVEPGVDHDNHNTRSLAIRFMDTMLGRRLPARPGEPIRALDTSTGWLGDVDSHETAPAARFTGKARDAVWLADEALAAAWREFSQTGDVTDTTPPPAPTHVRVTRTDGGMRVTWRARADVESGIAEFRISRDGQPIGVLRGAPDETRNRNGWLHAWDYHDQPHPPAAPPKFEHLDPAGTSQSQYQITTVNRAGLQSPPSKGTPLCIADISR